MINLMTLNEYLLILSCFFKYINSRQFIHFLLILIDCFVYAAVSLRERLCNSYIACKVRVKQQSICRNAQYWRLVWNEEEDEEEVYLQVQLAVKPMRIHGNIYNRKLMAKQCI